MASIYSIVGLLREEVEGRIRDLTPTARTDRPFKPRPSRDRKERGIMDCTGQDRLFEMSNPEGTPAYRNVWVGHNTRGIETHFPIIIVYKATEDWERAAMDDLEAISQDLRRNQSSVSGVEIREITFEDAQPQLIAHEEDPWMYGVLSLYALLRVS